MRRAVGLSSLAIVFLFRLTVSATETPTTEYRNIMKSIFGAIRNRGDDYKAIAKDAVTLQTNFAELERFWTEKKTDDAIVLAKAGGSAASDLERAAKSKDSVGIRAARQALLSTCVACHVAHVEPLTSTTFAIKYGASGESPAKGTAAPESASVLRPGNGVTSPVPTVVPKPKYTPDAMLVRVQGVVWVECTVQTDGACADTHIVRSLDPVFGLDQEALKAANLFRFKPAMRDSEPVAVLVTIELAFTLR
jgi:TonB family protein